MIVHLVAHTVASCHLDQADLDRASKSAKKGAARALPAIASASSASASAAGMGTPTALPTGYRGSYSERGEDARDDEMPVTNGKKVCGCNMHVLLTSCAYVS